MDKQRVGGTQLFKKHHFSLIHLLFVVFTGKMIFKTPEILNRMKEYNLIPVRYADDDSQSTITYPFNPNGSPDGVAALCSQDGRHLAIMPHPERCFLPWQCPWMPWEMKKQWDASPWFKMFQNAFEWSMERLHKSS